MRAARCALIAACTSLTPAALAAQQSPLLSALDVGTSSAPLPGGVRADAMLIAPMLRLDRPLASIEARGTFAGSSGQWSSDGEMRVSLFSPERFGLRFEMSAVAARTSDGEARLSFSRDGRGAWLGAARQWNSSSVLPPDVRRIDAGAWTRVGVNAIVTASVTTGSFVGETISYPTFIDTMPAQFQPAARQQSGVAAKLPERYADVESGLHWARGTLGVDATIGTRVSAASVSRTSWARGEASWAMSEAVAIVAGGGTRPSQPELGRESGRFATLAMRLTSVPFRSRTLPDGVRDGVRAFGVRTDGSARTIVVRAVGARIVELMGDFTDWEPVAMHRSSSDVWELTLSGTRAAPGAHRLNVRIDGAAWTAPPGASTVADEFNGTVGVIVFP